MTELATKILAHRKTGVNLNEVKRQARFDAALAYRTIPDKENDQERYLRIKTAIKIGIEVDRLDFVFVKGRDQKNRIQIQRDLGKAMRHFKPVSAPLVK